MPVDTEDDDMGASDGVVARVKSWWTRVRRGLTIDSGAADHVIPPNWIPGQAIEPSPGSKRGVKYVAADGAKLPNLGQMVVAFENGVGTAGKILFQVANITKPLVSVSKLIDDGHQVVFDKRASYIIHVESGRKMMLKRERGVFIVDAFVDPKRAPKNKSAGFRGRG